MEHEEHLILSSQTHTADAWGTWGAKIAEIVEPPVTIRASSKGGYTEERTLVAPAHKRQITQMMYKVGVGRLSSIELRGKHGRIELRPRPPSGTHANDDRGEYVEAEIHTDEEDKTARITETLRATQASAEDPPDTEKLLLGMLITLVTLWIGIAAGLLINAEDALWPYILLCAIMAPATGVVTYELTNVKHTPPLEGLAIAPPRSQPAATHDDRNTTR